MIIRTSLIHMRGWSAWLGDNRVDGHTSEVVAISALALMLDEKLMKLQRFERAAKAVRILLKGQCLVYQLVEAKAELSEALDAL